MIARTDETGHRRWPRLLGLLLAGLALLWLILAFVTLSSDSEANPGGGTAEQVVWAFDYKAYLGAASRVALSGAPYDETVTAGEFSSGPAGLYYYSPVLAVSLLPVEGLPSDDTSPWWYLLHVAALVAACALMPVSGTVRLFAFAVGAFSFAALRDLALGNVSVLLLLPTVLSWRWLDRPLGSIGLAVGVSIRPSLGLLLIWQLLRRAWRPAAWTVGGGLVLVLLTLPFVGLDGYVDYLVVLGNLDTPSNEAAPVGGWQNLDLGESIRTLGAGETAVTVARIASIALGIGAMLFSLRRDRETGFMVTLMASFLVVPLLWDHYLVMTVLPAAFLAQRWHPVAIALPLLSWIPVAGFVTVSLAMLLPFLVSDPDTSSSPDPLAPSRGAGSSSASAR